jgi:hypothetical protein
MMTAEHTTPPSRDAGTSAGPDLARNDICISRFAHSVPALHLDAEARAVRVEGEDLVSQVCRFATLDSPRFRLWLDRLGVPISLHRKHWELGYICQALQERGMLQPGRRGLGFAVGAERIPSYLASRGCTILASDLDGSDVRHDHWAASGQWVGHLAGLNQYGLCPAERFARQVSYRPVDMNRIPDELRDFDFTWSTCSFEHCGSIELGLEFMRRQMDCLRPGGIAVHTTEFNLSSNDATLESGPTVIFRLKDIEVLCQQLRDLGHSVEPLDVDPGTTPEDLEIDEPPYYAGRTGDADIRHLRLRLGGHVATSLGLIIRKAG